MLRSGETLYDKLYIALSNDKADELNAVLCDIANAYRSHPQAPLTVIARKNVKDLDRNTQNHLLPDLLAMASAFNKHDCRRYLQELLFGHYDIISGLRNAINYTLLPALQLIEGNKPELVKQLVRLVIKEYLYQDDGTRDRTSLPLKALPGFSDEMVFHILHYRSLYQPEGGKRYSEHPNGDVFLGIPDFSKLMNEFSLDELSLITTKIYNAILTHHEPWHPNHYNMLKLCYTLALYCGQVVILDTLFPKLVAYEEVRPNILLEISTLYTNIRQYTHNQNGSTQPAGNVFDMAWVKHIIDALTTLATLSDKVNTHKALDKVIAAVSGEVTDDVKQSLTRFQTALMQHQPERFASQFSFYSTINSDTPLFECLIKATCQVFDAHYKEMPIEKRRAIFGRISRVVKCIEMYPRNKKDLSQSRLTLFASLAQLFNHRIYKKNFLWKGREANVQYCADWLRRYPQLYSCRVLYLLTIMAPEDAFHPDIEHNDITLRTLSQHYSFAEMLSMADEETRVLLLEEINTNSNSQA